MDSTAQRDDGTASGHTTYRVLWLIPGLFAAALLVGVLLAPLVFNILTGLGRRFPALEALRNLEFERAASRTVLVCVILGLFPAMRIGGLRHWREAGWVRGPWRKPLGRGLLTGAVLLVAAYLLGLLTGAYTFALEPSWGVFGRLALYAAGALGVAVLEETLFRGLLFGMFRKAAGFWLAALLSSALYSLVHFAKPEPAVAVVYGHWYEGLRMVPYMFYFPGGLQQVFPFAATLLVLGLVLCATYERQGSLYGAVGLHASMIFWMRTGVYFLDRTPGHASFWFGSGSYLSKSYCALAVLLLLLVVVLARRGRASPEPEP